MRRVLALAAVIAALAVPGQSKAQYISTAIKGQTVLARDPALWPFTSDSPWNMPIGSGAVFAAPNAAISKELQASDAWMNIGTWSHPVWQAKLTDPKVSILDLENNRIFVVNVPKEARPDPKSDAHMYVVSPSRVYVTETYGTVIGNGRISAKRAFQSNLYGPGWGLSDDSYDSRKGYFGVRATNSSGMGGLIRVWEIQQLQIHHALVYLLPFANLKHGPVWPSNREDFVGSVRYTGHVPIGQLAAIPPTVDVNSLGLTPVGLAIAHALQDYGAYCGDSDGDTLIHFSVEDAAATQVPTSTINEMQKAIKKLRPYLLPVMNNTAATPAGGGVRRQPLAPPLAPQPLPPLE